MIIDPILRPAVQDFINENLRSDLHGLLLKKSPFPDVAMQDLVQQIKGKNVAQKKFPFLCEDGIVFPPNLNLEQASSQATAEYKANLFSGKTMIDLTSGFGIDAYFLSQNFKEVTLVEQNSSLLNLVQHNWRILGKKAEFRNEQLENILSQQSGEYDLIYLDPARRDTAKNKKFLMQDLSPNIIGIQDQLFDLSNKILIKLSPLIDISYLISTLQNVAEIHIVAVRNDVKELLIFLNKKPESDQVKIISKNLESQESPFSFFYRDEKNAHSLYSVPDEFLYIPNNAVLKAGAFNSLSQYFGLHKLHPNSHLYTSAVFIEQFPGRIFRVEKMDSKDIKKGEKYNIISKNYPLSPDDIKKKYKINDGGKRYLIFTQSVQGKVILRSI